DVVAWPLGDPRLITYGTLKPVFDIISDFAAPIFCFFGTGASDIPLISGPAPGAVDRVPGDPIGVLGHPVPGVVPPPPPPAPTNRPPPTPPPALTVNNTNSPMALCGDHIFETVSIASGAILNVATTADSTPVFAGGPARCVAGKENKLSIAAGGSANANAA